MAKRMLIDAAHPEETRVVVLSGNRLEEFDFEVVHQETGKRQHLPREGYAGRTVAAGRLCRLWRQPARLSGLQRDPSGLLPHPGQRPVGSRRRAGKAVRPRRGEWRRRIRRAARGGIARAGAGAGTLARATRTRPPRKSEPRSARPTANTRSPRDGEHAGAPRGRRHADIRTGARFPCSGDRRGAGDRLERAAPASRARRPEHSAGSEHCQEPEPTLAAWQEDWQPPPTGPAQHEAAAHDSNQATGLWDEAARRWCRRPGFGTGVDCVARRRRIRRLGRDRRHAGEWRCG